MSLIESCLEACDESACEFPGYGTRTLPDAGRRGCSNGGDTVVGLCALVIGGAATAVMMAEDRREFAVFVDDENIENRALLKVKSRFNNQVHVNITSYNRHVLDQR